MAQRNTRWLTKMQAAQYLGEGFSEKQIVRAGKKHPAFQDAKSRIVNGANETPIKRGKFEGTNIDATWYADWALDEYRKNPGIQRVASTVSGQGKLYKMRLTDADVAAMRAGTLTAERQAELLEAAKPASKYDSATSSERRKDRKAGKKLGLTLAEYRERKAAGTLPAAPVSVAPAAAAEATEADDLEDEDELDDEDDEEGDEDEDEEGEDDAE